ncbi:hypothetical protein B0H39_002483 [Clostridium beijerinckii]|uniref:hypothetical protein n=1 Tax=Clostridium beijerinckii TaxID=1520 RepID=UPI001494D506|nr:hypothetical protein [Clostridium beijerinckii]NOW84602.1 hypothetical protein [Clostridium beijerinckii]
MKRLRKVISLLIVASVITVNSIQANASTTGWQGNNSEGWWYVDSTGNYVTGWQEIGGQWYYFDQNGWMLSNKWIDGYYLSSTGAWDSTNGNRADYFKNKAQGTVKAGSDPQSAQSMAEANK